MSFARLFLARSSRRKCVRLISVCLEVGGCVPTVYVLCLKPGVPRNWPLHSHQIWALHIVVTVVRRISSTCPLAVNTLCRFGAVMIVGNRAADKVNAVQRVVRFRALFVLRFGGRVCWRARSPGIGARLHLDRLVVHLRWSRLGATLHFGRCRCVGPCNRPQPWQFFFLACGGKC